MPVIFRDRDCFSKSLPSWDILNKNILNREYLHLHCRRSTNHVLATFKYNSQSMQIFLMTLVDMASLQK